MMSTTRLRGLYKQEQNHRKFACVHNDMIKTKQEQFEGYIDREKQESIQKSDKSIVVTRKQVVRQHVLAKCMKNKREEIERKHASNLYGKYNGVGIDEIASNINPFIEKNHPRIRRKKKIEELFKRGYRKGAILDANTVHTKVEQYFEKPLVEIHVETKTDEINAPINHPDLRPSTKSFLPPLSSTFYTADQQSIKHASGSTRQSDDKDNQSIQHKVRKYLEEDIPDDASMHSEVTSFPKMTSSRVIRPITLPPMKIGTDNSTADGKPKTDSIADIISRINYAKERREREAKVKKEKRERRILAEKVRGIGHFDSANEFVNNSLIADDDGIPEHPVFNKRSDIVPSNKGVGLLNLTAPVIRKPKQNRSRNRSDGQRAYNHVNESYVGQKSDAKNSNTGGGFILPPLKLKRHSISDKD